MAESQSAKTHYIVGENDVWEQVRHIWALSAEDAVTEFMEEMDDAYGLAEYDVYAIYCVPATAVTPFTAEVEVRPRTIITKGKKGDL